MRVASIVLLLAAGTAFADKGDGSIGERGDKFLAAVQKNDAKTAAMFVEFPFKTTHLWFDDNVCSEKFKDAELAADDFPALVACLAKLGLSSAPVTPGRPMWTYDPGVGMAPWLHGEKFDGLLGMLIDDQPWVTRSALVAHLSKGSFDVTPDAPVESTDGTATAFAATEFCVTGKGMLEDFKVERASDKAYGAKVEAAAKSWRFAPFTRNSRKLRVCSHFDVTYPAGSKVDRAAFHAAGDTPYVKPLLFERLRTAGDPAIVPDDVTKDEIIAANKDKVVGAFKVCLDDTGEVASVEAVKSSGYPKYDTKIINTIRATWEYRPYVVDGAPKAVCTMVTFIYATK